MGKFRALETDLERMKEKIEVENEAKAEIQKAMSKALAEAQIWKSKYTTEACARIEDLENAKAKLLVCKLQKLQFLSKKHLGKKNFFEPILLLILHNMNFHIVQNWLFLAFCRNCIFGQKLDFWDSVVYLSIELPLS